MEVFDPGYQYMLDIYDGDEGQKHLLTFMKREGAKFPGNVGHHIGTNCQEVLRALINRVIYLNNQVPCKENTIILTLLRVALLQFELRAARRHGRKLPVYVGNIEDQPFCHKCGHIGCHENH